MMMAAGFESGSDMIADIEEQLKAQLPPEMISEDMTVLDILKKVTGDVRYYNSQLMKHPFTTW